MSEDECDAIFLTQTKTCERVSSEEWTDAFIHPEIADFTGERASDDELSQVAAKADIAYYEDISSPEDEAVPAPPVQGNITHTFTSQRFKAPKSDAEMNGYGIRSLSSSTLKKVKWATDLFASWQSSRNEIALFDQSISPIKPALENMTKDEVCYSIARCLCEVKKVSGEEHPPRTLYELVITLQLYLETKGKHFKLLQDPTFLQLKNTLDHVMKERSNEGVTTRGRKAEVITHLEEERLWEHVLGFDSPQKLVDTVLYLIGLNFALRAATEHRNLRWANSQLRVLEDTNGRPYLRYSEDVSKGNQGGLKHKDVKRKVVYAYGDPTNPQKCIVRAFQIYDSHCPKDRPALYLRPLDHPKGDLWYSSQPIGVKTLAKTVGRLCEQAGVKGFRTNHSLRATAATRLYEAEVDEQLITEITGHRSVAVREYKRTNDDQRFCGSSIVSGRVAGNRKDPVPAKFVKYDGGQTSTTYSTEERGLTMPHITLNVNVQK